MLASRRQTGDTIIEVLIAITVFSLLAVGALAIMNRGTAIAQQALEITLVRQQIDAQVEAIRYIHQQHTDGTDSKEWSKMVEPIDQGGKAVTVSSNFGIVNGGGCQPIPSNAFILNARSAMVASDAKGPKSSESPGSPVYAQVVYSDADNSLVAAYGIWVEAVKKTASQDFVDFHVRSCWHGPTSGPATTLGTIVRLYAPN